MLQPVVTSPLVRWAAVCVLTALLSPGCAHTTTVTAWSPAEIDVTGIQRLTVLGFSGEAGHLVTSKLTKSLGQNEFYTVFDHGALQPIQWTSGVSGSRGLLSLDDLNAAQHGDVDGIITGEVLEYECNDVPVDAADPKSQGDQPSHIESDRDASEQPSQQEVRRDATVTITFRLIDAQSGDVRATKQTSHSFQDIVVIGRPSTRTHSEVLAELTRQCVDEFVCVLAPHQVEEQVTLAKPTLFEPGYSLARNGNEFACRGRWDEALVAWEQALVCNPENDAALYNLSIAHAHRQDFAQAEIMATKAMNVRHKPLYEAGLQRIRQQMTDFDETLQQRRDLRVGCRIVGCR